MKNSNRKEIKTWQHDILRQYNFSRFYHYTIIILIVFFLKNIFFSQFYQEERALKRYVFGCLNDFITLLYKYY